MSFFDPTYIEPVHLPRQPGGTSLSPQQYALSQLNNGGLGPLSPEQQAMASQQIQSGQGGQGGFILPNVFSTPSTSAAQQLPPGTRLPYTPDIGGILKQSYQDGTFPSQSQTNSIINATLNQAATGKMPSADWYAKTQAINAKMGSDPSIKQQQAEIGLSGLNRTNPALGYNLALKAQNGGLQAPQSAGPSSMAQAPIAAPPKNPQSDPNTYAIPESQVQHMADTRALITDPEVKAHYDNEIHNSYNMMYNHGVKNGAIPQENALHPSQDTPVRPPIGALMGPVVPPTPQGAINTPGIQGSTISYAASPQQQGPWDIYNPTNENSQ